ncbi:MAG: TIGR03013 family PEP-CTERM/XrtA system glycosyltransferase [Hahellaceae bacterium]|nr:TIGR03013 family PEP-CTERM/XrtA system glycosyltransferase [Hahellaceae bacterium]
MAHIRVFKHYLHLPFVMLGLLESIAYIAAVYLAVEVRFSLADLASVHNFEKVLPSALVYSYTMLLCMNAMGVYQAKIKEGNTGMLLRTIVAFIIGSAIYPFFYYLSSDTFGVLWRSVLLLATGFSLVLVVLVRTCFYTFVDDNLFKRKVIIFGAGVKAKALFNSFQTEDDKKGFVVQGFCAIDDETVHVDSQLVINYKYGLKNLVTSMGIDEVVIAVDDRRKKLPMDELMDCKMDGIEITDGAKFFERETRKVSLDMISPSWFIFSEGFNLSSASAWLKRGFDILVSLVVLSLTWPFMLITAIAIKWEDGWKHPIFYKQTRIGLNGLPFDVIKFRSMIVDAEKEGKAIWASKNDARITRVGNIIRKYRIDELPQIFNVLMGSMAFVGPRPERPTFVAQLSQKIPYYDERHRVKPGITGWAQLCFAYADSEEDSQEKLRYDLYYIKNQSLMLDALIILQTLEVVLFKKGAH